MNPRLLLPPVAWSSSRAGRRAPWCAVFLLVAFTAASCGPAFAAEGGAIPGWHAALAAPGLSVHARVPSAAFALGAGETLDPQLPPRGFDATYRARLVPPGPGAYAFSVEAEGGDAELKVTGPNGGDLAFCATQGRGRAATAQVRLEAPVQLVVTFKRGAGETARLRTLWEQSGVDGFAPEPVPPGAVEVPAELAADAENAELALEGRVLLQVKGCANCHEAAPSVVAAIGAARPAPVLSTLARRASMQWLEHWLGAFASGMARGDMPSPFVGDETERTRAVEDLTHYLASLSQPDAGPGDPSGAAVDRGRRLYHSVGCIACHGPLESPSEVLHDPFLPDEPPAYLAPRPYGPIASKWRRTALEELLRDPASVYPDGRMPSLRLDDREASAIAAYLHTLMGPAEDAAPFVPDPERAARGRETFAALGCASCHRFEGAPESGRMGKPLAALDAGRGCLDPDDASTPRYTLTPRERKALAAGLAAAGRSMGRDAPLDLARRVTRALNCFACHGKDGGGGVPQALRVYFQSNDDRVDLGDEGRIPPELTQVGFKLQTAWIDEVLRHGGVARPYMSARMPQFSSPALDGLAAAFSAENGVAPGADADRPARDEAAVQNGHVLVGTGGLSCVTCHVYKDLPPTGSPGPDLTRFARRIRYEWWRAFFPLPSRYKPGTRMPAFNLGGQTGVTGIYGGDWRRQADALWSYFELGDGMAPPEGVQPAGALMLVPTERTIVVRAFLPEAGPKGIAVGTPAGVHFAFDAEGVRLVDAWTGSFVDAAGAWAGRGGQELGGEGPAVWTAPEGPPLVAGAEPAAWPEATGKDASYRFRGYRLAKDGTPTFSYDVGGCRVTERFEGHVAPALTIVRSFTIADVPPDATLWLNAGRGSVALKDVTGAFERHEAADGSTRFALHPQDGALRFNLEIVP